jgi:RNA polymerase sigma factor (sigma-70 family)
MHTDFSFEEIYGQHKDMVYNLCLNYLQNQEDAAEATQDVFVKVHEKRAGFEGKSSMKTWIYRIAVHQCLDMLKARKRQKRFGFVTSLFGGQNSPEVELPDFNHPGVQLENKEALEALFQQINGLPANQKTVIVLKYLDDLPQKEIADILQLSVKAVESLLQRAKQNLEKKMPQAKDSRKVVVQTDSYEGSIKP